MATTKQNRLNRISKKFDRLQTRFRKHGTALERKDTFLEDTLINLETEKLQNELFQFRQRTGKEKIGVKHDCSNYLSYIFKRRKD